MYNYRIIRCQRKNLSISINDNAEVLVAAPKSVPKSKIEKFVQSKEKWITKSLEKYRNKRYNIDTLENDGAIYKLGKKVYFLCPRENAKENVDDFYYEGRKYLIERLEYLSKKHFLNYNSFGFGRSRSYWGTCNSKKRIVLNEKLYSLPPHLIDYVITHELVHTIHLNHSKEFWSTLEYYLPNAKQIRKELMTYSWLIYLYENKT